MISVQLYTGHQLDSSQLDIMSIFNLGLWLNNLQLLRA